MSQRIRARFHIRTSESSIDLAWIIHDTLRCNVHLDGGDYVALGPPCSTMRCIASAARHCGLLVGTSNLNVSLGGLMNNAR